MKTCVYMTPAECGYQILVTQICEGGMVSYILTNFIPNLSALNSKPLLVS